MAQLTINFLNLMLFWQRDSGLTVLLPSRGHDAYLEWPGRIDKFQMSGELVQILQDGAPIWGRTSIDTGARSYLFDLATLRPGGWPLKPSRLLKSSLSGRLELGGAQSTLTAHACPPPPPGTKDYREFFWYFTEDIGHKLTNNAQFVLPLKPGDQGSPSSYQILVSGGAANRCILQDIPADAQPIYVTVEEGARRPFGLQLDEFSELYDVFDDNGNATQWTLMPTDPGATGPATDQPLDENDQCQYPLCPLGVVSNARYSDA